MIAVEKQLQHVRDFLASIPGAADKAMARALNKAAAAGRESAVRAITDRYAVQAGDVREKITVSAATPEQLSVSVEAKSPSLALGYFPHTPDQPGTGGPGRPVLRAEVLRGQERDVPGAFVAMINGQPRIMTRSGKSIRSVYSVPIANMLGADSVRAAVEARALAVIDEQLDREIDRALGKVA